MKFIKFLELIFIFAIAYIANAKDFCNNASHSGESETITSNNTGSINGNKYSLWAKGGEANATFYSDGSFSTSFQNITELSCYSGLSFDASKKHDEIGHLYADFNLKFNIEEPYIMLTGVYGQTEKRRTEFYILQNFSYELTYYLGSRKFYNYTIDGVNYTVFDNYVNTIGDMSMYYAYPHENRDCGTIDITAHLNQWKKLGLGLGKLKEIKIFGEVDSSIGTSGTIDFPYAKVYIEEEEEGEKESPSTRSDCSASILSQGYECCGSNCKVIYTDSDGTWGYENDNWCGCNDNSSETTTTTSTTTTTTTTSSPTNNTDFCKNSNHSGSSITTSSKERDRIDGIGYTLWGSGEHSATFYSDGSFSSSFQNSYVEECFSGLTFDKTKTHDQIGHLYANFTLNHNIENAQYFNIGIGGKTENPSVEFFIIENRINDNILKNMLARNKHYNYTIDGADYTILEDVSIFEGVLTSWRKDITYYSYRHESRECGAIDITAHFKQWEEFGLNLGKMEEVKIGGILFSNSKPYASGSFDFPYAKVYIEEQEEDKESLSTRSDCSDSILSQGYECCGSNCKVIYTDSDGTWGYENDNWCGCKKIKIKN